MKPTSRDWLTFLGMLACAVLVAIAFTVAVP
jgi:hypothetical protein